MKLDAEIDALKTSLPLIVDRINAFGLRLEVWAEEPLYQSEWSLVWGTETDVERLVIDLGYGLRGDEWALLLRRRRQLRRMNNVDRDYDYEYELLSTQPLPDASRELCIAAAKMLPSLIVQLRQAAEEAIDSIQRVSEIANSPGLAASRFLAT
jgi:hypothetical protein